MQVNFLGKSYLTSSRKTSGGSVLRFTHFSRRLSLDSSPPFIDSIFRFVLRGKLALIGRFWERAAQAVVQLSDEVPDDYQALWNSEKKRIMLCLWKDADYFKRRYGGTESVKFFSLRKRGKLCGLSVTVRRGNLAYVAELLVEDLDVSGARLLVNRTLAHHLSERVRAVQFFGHDHGFFRRAFSGFDLMGPSGQFFSLGATVTPDLDSVFIEAKNWNLTTGDAGIF